VIGVAFHFCVVVDTGGNDEAMRLLTLKNLPSPYQEKLGRKGLIARMMIAERRLFELFLLLY